MKVLNLDIYPLLKTNWYKVKVKDFGFVYVYVYVYVQ